VAGVDRAAGVGGRDFDTSLVERRELAPRAQADGRVEGLRVLVEKVQRPDVHRAAGQIDTSGCGGSDAHAQIIMAESMSLRDIRRHVGQLLVGGFDGHSIPSDLKALAREFDLGGVIFFARNVVEPAQVAELAREARNLRRELPLWVSVDQEGGRVARLKRPFTEWPPMLALGRSGDEKLAERFARALAAEMAAVGINLDYTPVLDIYTNPKNTVIGDRAFGERAEEVARFGRIVIRTLQNAGIAACGKHFPGHGDTIADSHDELPIVEHDPDRIRRVEVEPFKAAIEEEVAAIMTAHVLVPAFDEERPATLSPAIVDGLLKHDLGYGGLVLTDDMQMKALSARYSIGDSAVGALAAGCDALLIGNGGQEPQVTALEAVIHAVEEDRLSIKRVEDAMTRHRRVKERFLAGRRDDARAALADVIGRGEHLAIAEEMARFL
jgi:beta-N-acetylhexosaminidase